MGRTIFNTPVLTPIIRTLSNAILKAIGWHVVGKIPDDVKKYVVVVAPHTSNWDFPICFMTAFVLKLNAHWIGKHTLFPRPFRRFMMWIGGIPVNRQLKGDTVVKTAQLFRERNEFAIGISPEGTRKPVANWHKGFWYIAHDAGVPIIIAYIDYKLKECGIYGVFVSAGHVGLDIDIMKTIYLRFTPKYPRNFKV